jgi:hypothetical protein
MKYIVTIEHRFYQIEEVEAEDAYEAERIAVERPINLNHLDGRESEIVETEIDVQLEAAQI